MWLATQAREAYHKHVQARYAELLKDVPGIHLHEAPYVDFDANY